MSIERFLEEDKTVVMIKHGEPVREKEFKLKDLKSRGLSLYYGEEIGGEETYFLTTEELEVGDVYDSGAISYRVERVIEKLPRKSKVLLTINDDGLIRIILKLYNIETGEYTEYTIYEVYADELLKRVADRLKLGEIMNNLNAADVVTILEKGDCFGIGIDIESTIPKYRRSLRAARKILKKLSYGEFRLRVCDIESFWTLIKLSTLELLDTETAKAVDSLLGMLARPE